MKLLRKEASEVHFTSFQKEMQNVRDNTKSENTYDRHIREAERVAQQHVLENLENESSKLGSIGIGPEVR
jgi:hypothetical protein